MKKLTAILLAVLLVLSLSITAFAANDKTITVNGAENGQTYELYKIFDVSTVNGEAAYSIPSGRTGYETSSYEQKDDNGAKHTVNFSDIFATNTLNGKTYVTRKNGTTDDHVIYWAKANTGLFGTATTKEATEGKVQFTGLDDGYYYVKSPVGNGATVMLADTSQTATINEKNSTPGWGTGPDVGKNANGDTFYAGDTITYTLNYYNAVNYDAGKQVTKYTIEDTMDTGITYKADSVRVWVNGEEITGLTNEAATGTNGFKVVIPWADSSVDGEGKTVYTSKYKQNPSTIKVTYEATMGTTHNNNGFKNTAKIYPDTNTNPGDDTKKDDTVYTGKITINKIEKIKDQPNKPLSGAKFIVKVGVGDDATSKYLQLDNDGKFTEVDKAQATEFITNDAGQIILTGLKAGTYTIIETEAPAGYQLPTDSAPAVVILTTEKDEYGAVMVGTKTIVNGKAAAMPETGGMGTTMFYVIGSLLALSAVVMLVTQKRMRAVQ